MSDGKMRMPWGKHKGEPIEDTEAGYDACGKCSVIRSQRNTGGECKGPVRVGPRAPEGQEKGPDVNCITRPDGECIGGLAWGNKPCMHDAPAPPVSQPSVEPRRVEFCHHGREIACQECVDEGPQEEYLLRADRNRLTQEIERLRGELNSVNGHWPEIQRSRERIRSLEAQVEEAKRTRDEHYEVLKLAQRELAQVREERDSAVAAREQALEAGRDYIASTDPYLACGPADDPTNGKCGDCRACALERAEAAERDAAGLREALRELNEYTNQLELLAYDELERINTHPTVRKAQALLAPTKPKREGE